ncbi:MAG: HPr family phosphocarrier protein [Desulfuromonas sp.]|nr:MAG: HPr family phosphocarrier protein [Desulfuromonas sp.]
MEKREFTIKNRLGLHARAAAQLVKTANQYKAEILIEKEGIEVNGKSIMGILMLAAPQGSVITVSTNGEEATVAMQNLAELIDDGFGEH